MPIPKYGTVYLVENSDMKLRNVGSVHTTLEDKKSYNGVPREYPSVITDMKYENNREFKALMEYMGKKIEYSGSGFECIVDDINNVSYHTIYIASWEHAKGFLFMRNDNGNISYVTFLVDMFDTRWDFCHGHSINPPRTHTDKSMKIDYEEVKDCYRCSFVNQVRKHDDGESHYLTGDQVEFMRSAMVDFDKKCAI